MKNVKAIIVIVIDTKNTGFGEQLDQELQFIAAGTISRYQRKFPGLRALQINCGGHTFIKNAFTKPAQSHLYETTQAPKNNIESFLLCLRQHVSSFLSQIQFNPDDKIALFITAHGLTKSGVHPCIHASIANMIFQESRQRLKYFYILQCFFAAQPDLRASSSRSSTSYFDELAFYLPLIFLHEVKLFAWSRFITVSARNPEIRVPASYPSHRYDISVKQDKYTYDRVNQQITRIVEVSGDVSDSDDDNLKISPAQTLITRDNNTYLELIIDNPPQGKYTFQLITIPPPTIPTITSDDSFTGVFTQRNPDENVLDFDWIPDWDSDDDDSVPPPPAISIVQQQHRALPVRPQQPHNIPQSQ